MRIYTDTMDWKHVRAALNDAKQESPSINFAINLNDEQPVTSYRARKRKIRHEVALHGWGARHTRLRNPGTSPYRRDDYAGYNEQFAATWMDWGWFIAVMFRYEPTAIIGQYDGIEAFHAATSGATLAHRLRIDPSVKNFARECAAIWDRESSPFLLVDRLCPPVSLVDFENVAQVETWLTTA